MTAPAGSSHPPGSFEDEALPWLDAVYRFSLRLAGSPDAAHDLTQETFLRAYRAWDQYTPGTRCKSWLFTICRNVFLRKRERRDRHDEIVAEQSEASRDRGDPVNPIWSSVSGLDPEGDFFASIVDETIVEEIGKLGEEFRTALVLSDIEGLTYKEIADLMEVPIGTVKSRLFRARRRLQEALYDYAVETGYLQPERRTAE